MAEPLAAGEVAVGTFATLEQLPAAGREPAKPAAAVGLTTACMAGVRGAGIVARLLQVQRGSDAVAAVRRRQCTAPSAAAQQTRASSHRRQPKRPASAPTRRRVGMRLVRQARQWARLATAPPVPAGMPDRRPLASKGRALRKREEAARTAVGCSSQAGMSPSSRQTAMDGFPRARHWQSFRWRPGGTHPQGRRARAPTRPPVAAHALAPSLDLQQGGALET